MRKTRECSNLKTLGADIKAARHALRLTRRALAEQLGIESALSGQHRKQRQFAQPAHFLLAGAHLQAATGTLLF